MSNKNKIPILLVFMLLLCFSLRAQAQSTYEQYLVSGEPIPTIQIIGMESSDFIGTGLLTGLTDLEMDAYREDLRFILGVEELFALPPDQRPPLNPVTTEEIQGDGYVIAKLYYESIPGFYVSANLYVPDDPDNFPLPRPGVICPHGHWIGSKSSREVQVRSIGLVLQGYVVLAYDAVGTGDRHNGYFGEGHGSCSSSQAYVGGPLSMGLQAYEVSRAIDYMASRTDLVDSDQLAVTGASGGSSQTIYTAAIALDDRIQTIVPVCFRTVALEQQFGCGCEVIPYFGYFMEREVLLALVFASRVLYLDESDQCMNIAEETYFEHGMGERYRFHLEPEEPHGYTQPFREWMYAWLSRWLLGIPVEDTLPDPDGVSDEMEIRTNQELSVSLPADRLSFLDVTAQIRQGLPDIALPETQQEWDQLHVSLDASLRALANWPQGGQLVDLVPGEPSENPETILLLPEELTLQYYFNGENHFWESWIELELYKPSGPMPWPCMVLLNPKEYLDGTSFYQQQYQPIDDSGVISSLTDEGYAVLKPTFRFNEIPPDFPDTVTDFTWEESASRKLNYEGYPLYWRRVYDVGVILSYLESRPDILSGRVSLWGLGAGAPMAFSSGALEDRACQVVADRSLLSFSVSESERHPVWSFPPRVLYTADIPQIGGMIAPRTLVVAAARDSLRVPLGLSEMQDRLEWTDEAYDAANASSSFHILTGSDPGQLVSLLTSECGSCEGCWIQDSCMVEGQINPENVCLICDPVRSRTDWSGNDGVACDDGTFCNGDDSCSDGACSVHTGDPCGDGLFCNGTECDEVGDQCQPSSGNPCPMDDGLYCNGEETSECFEDTDSCGHTGDPCPDDGAFCNGTESCDEVEDQCESSGNPCDDGTFCNGTEDCDEASDLCPGTSSGDPCPDDGLFCNGFESCDEEDEQCATTDDPCNTDNCEVCNEENDQCDIAYFVPCEDGLFCTIDDHCDGTGACVGYTRNCSYMADECHWGECDDEGDQCYAANKPNGVSCEDDFWCTVNDVCTDGMCGGSVRDCDDGQFCNGTESCDEAGDLCVNSGNPCDPVTQTCNEDDDVCEDLECAMGHLCSTVYLHGFWDGSQHTCSTTVDIELYSDPGLAADYVFTDESLASDGTFEVDLATEGVASGSYYVVVRHYNHLDLITASALSWDGSSPVQVDFSVVANVSQGESALKYDKSTWCMPGGDATGDNHVNLADYGRLLTNWNGQNQGADFDCDGFCRLSDYPILLGTWNMQSYAP